MQSSSLDALLCGRVCGLLGNLDICPSAQVYLPTSVLEALKHRRRKRDKFMACMRRSRTCIIALDRHGYVQAASPVALEVFGYTSAELAGVHIAVLAPDLHPEGTELLGHCDTAGRLLIGVPAEENGRRKDGSRFPIGLVVEKLSINGRDVLICGIHDLTTFNRDRDRMALLLGEAIHRTTNIIAVIQAIAYHTAAADPMDFVESFAGRLASLAATLKLLSPEESSRADLGALVRMQLGHFISTFGERIRVSGPTVQMPAEVAQLIGMAIHELATNAAKYGALSNIDGRVDIHWYFCRRSTERFAIVWKESGGPRVVPPRRHGFGNQVIDKGLSTLLDADVDVNHYPEGLSWQFECEADRILPGGDMGKR